jgi:hypothetical protein
MAQTVPSEEAAAAAVAMTRSSLASDSDATTDHFVVYDEDPVPLEAVRPESGRTQRRPTPPLPPVDPGSSEPVDVQSAPDMILFRRRTIYVQGVLFVAVGAVAFVAGYFIGRGDASADLSKTHEEVTRQTVLLEGRLVYDPGDGLRAGDDGAVAIALPRSANPQPPFAGQGIRPGDPELADTQESIRRIQQCGGAYARAGKSGVFSFVLPRPGPYHLLLISAHAVRPDDGPMDELDLKEIGEYFLQPEQLIGSFKYRWMALEIGLDAAPVEHDFDADAVDEVDYAIP